MVLAQASLFLNRSPMIEIFASASYAMMAPISILNVMKFV
jgi:hypothetical protein